MKITIFSRLIIFAPFFAAFVYFEARDVIEIRHGNKTRTFFYSTCTFFCLECYVNVVMAVIVNRTWKILKNADEKRASGFL
jgi:hypothetical protein